MEEKKDKIFNIPLDDIIPNRFQPRLAFDDKELENLSNSISKYGVIQPIVLRNIGDKYEIIAGERRYKASCLAGLKTIPAIINNTDDNTSAEIALLENLQRKNLTPIEEAQSYKKLIDRNFTQEEIASKLGISQSSVANKLRLLNLSKKVQNALLYSKISERHARSLLTINDENLQNDILDRIINERLTVKQTEEVIDNILTKKTKGIDVPKEIEKFVNGESIDIKKESSDDIENQFRIKKLDEILEKKLNEETAKNLYDYKIPEVVNIDDKLDSGFKINEYQGKKEDINPFQMNNNMSNIYNRLYQNFEQKEMITQEHIHNTNVNDDSTTTVKQEINIPNIISTIRKYIDELEVNNKNIKTNEKDLPDKYQIIIEIEK